MKKIISCSLTVVGERGVKGSISFNLTNMKFKL